MKSFSFTVPPFPDLFDNSGGMNLSKEAHMRSMHCVPATTPFGSLHIGQLIGKLEVIMFNMEISDTMSFAHGRPTASSIRIQTYISTGPNLIHDATVVDFSEL